MFEVKDLEPEEQSKLSDAIELHVDTDNFTGTIDIKNENISSVSAKDFTYLHQKF